MAIVSQIVSSFSSNRYTHEYPIATMDPANRGLRLFLFMSFFGYVKSYLCSPSSCLEYSRIDLQKGLRLARPVGAGLLNDQPTRDNAQTRVLRFAAVGQQTRQWVSLSLANCESVYKTCSPVVGCASGQSCLSLDSFSGHSLGDASDEIWSCTTFGGWRSVGLSQYDSQL